MKRRMASQRPAPSHRTDLVPFLAGALALALGACAPAQPAASPRDSAAPPAAAPAPSEPAPQRGGVFQVVSTRELPHLNLWSNTDTNINFYLVGVYDQLLDYDYRPFQDWREEYKVVPSLAERWEVKDRTTYRFSLRRDVKWHDGAPFTAHDVKWSYESLGDPANAFAGGVAVRNVENMTVLDDHTLQIVTRTPDVLFLDGLTDKLASILPKHVFERGDKFERVAVGTGPFKVGSYDRQRGVDYVPNGDYWEPGRPYVARWRIFPPQDVAGQTAAFLARQSDVLKVQDKPQADVVLRQAPDAKSLVFMRDLAVDMFLKLDRPPFNDLRVRQAVHLATDRQAMVKALTFGTGLVNPPSINSARKALALPQEELQALPGWRPAKDQDLVEAKRLLAEAGHGAGLTFSAKVESANPSGPPVAQVVSAQLRAAGIDMKIETFERGVFDRAREEGDFEAYVHSQSKTAPERDWFLLYHSKGKSNASPIRDPELDRLIDAQAMEFDPAKRRQLFLDIQRLLVRQMYVIPFVTYSSYLMWQPYVNGWVDNQAGITSNMDWGQLWLDQATVPKDRS